MATLYEKHFAAAQRIAVREGGAAELVALRIGRFESLFVANPALPQQLEDVGLLAAACNRIALGAKFERNDVEERLARGELGYQARVDAKLCLMNLGLMD